MPPDYYFLKALGVLPSSVGAYNPFPSYSAYSPIPSFSTQSLPGCHILDHQPFIIQHPFPQARPVLYLNYCSSSLALPLAPPIHSPQGSGVILKQKEDHAPPRFQFPNDFLSYSEGLLYLVSSWPFLQSNLILFSFLHSTFQWQQLFFNLSNMT